MKTMTCQQLGGPCDLGHQGESADDVIKAQDQHLKDAADAAAKIWDEWTPKVMRDLIISSMPATIDVADHPRIFARAETERRSGRLCVCRHA